MGNMEHFKKLNTIDVSDKVEAKKAGGTELTYLSWAWAWAEVKKVYPDAQYEIVKFDNLPYLYDPKTGYIVYTRVTIEGLTHEMWLPVLDSNNMAMKDHPYEYTTKAGKKTVNAADMFDINKTLMRCLTKNLAMFGLGLYIFAGEDLPEDVEAPEKPKKEADKKEKPAPKVNAPETPVYHCSDCNKEIKADVYNYSRKVLGRPLCMACQEKAKAETKEEPKTEPETHDEPLSKNGKINPADIKVGDTFDNAPTNEAIAMAMARHESTPDEQLKLTPAEEEPAPLPTGLGEKVKLPFDDDGTEPVHVDTLAILEKHFYEESVLRQTKINEFIFRKYGAKTIDDLTEEQAQYVLGVLKKK